MSKKDITPTNAEGYGHGLWIWYYNNGNVMCKQRCVNGMLCGIDESYLFDGELFYKDYYINGESVYSEWYDSENRILITI